MIKPTEVFAAMLDLMEFDLVKYEDGYGLIDLQGANLCGIESDRFKTAEQIIERLDVYLNDYYFEVLENEAEEYGLYDAAREAMKDQATTEEGWVWFAHSWKGDQEVDKFVQDHQHDFDVMDMIVNHLAEVDLDEIAVSFEEWEEKKWG